MPAFEARRDRFQVLRFLVSGALVLISRLEPGTWSWNPEPV